MKLDIKPESKCLLMIMKKGMVSGQVLSHSILEEDDKQKRVVMFWTRPGDDDHNPIIIEYQEQINQVSSIMSSAVDQGFNLMLVEYPKDCKTSDDVIVHILNDNNDGSIRKGK
jgi:hypothetical protein